MSANDTQIGGSHYGGGEYQHWDWVYDVRLPYHPATASKYVDRHRSKNGAEDLQKALHYLQKSQELGIQGSSVVVRHAKFWRYVTARNHTLVDSEILWYIMEGNWQAAMEAIEILLAQTASDSRRT